MLVLAHHLALSLNCPAQKHCDEMQDVSLLNPVSVCTESFCVFGNIKFSYCFNSC